MSNGETVTAKRILQMLESQRCQCALSGRALTPETASIDHIVPVALGGTHDMSNIWIADHRINLAKGTLTTEEFVTMCREVVAHNAGQAKQPDDPNHARGDVIGTPPQTVLEDRTRNGREESFCLSTRRTHR